MGMGEQRHAPAVLTPGKTRYPLYRRLGLNGYGKSRPPPGFDLRTVQSVASRYTDWANPASSENRMSKQNKRRLLKGPKNEEEIGEMWTERVKKK